MISDITITIVTYGETYSILEKTLNNLKEFKVILVDNSNNIFLKKKILDKYNNIDFIIRVHEDNYCNNWLLKDKNNYKNNYKKLLPLTFSKTFENLDEKYKDAIQYQVKKNNNKFSKSNGAYCKIITRDFILNKKNLIDNKYHPVLTISTNSDIGRTLFNDSYAILD